MARLINNKKKFSGLLGILSVILLWVLASHFNWLGKTLLASPGEVFMNIKRGFNRNTPDSGRFYIHAWHTITLSFDGWIISLLLGTCLGLLLGTLKNLYKSFDIVFEFMRAIPPIFAFPLMLVAFNFNNEAYTWTIVFGCLPVMILTVAHGVQLISDDALQILRINKVSTTTRALAAGIEVMPSIFLAARLTFSIALIITVVSEMVSTPKSGFGIGAFARDSEINFDAPTFYTCVITIGLYGYLMNFLLKKIGMIFGTEQKND